jgi:phosphate-selective porin OprO/OprP
MNTVKQVKLLIVIIFAIPIWEVQAKDYPHNELSGYVMLDHDIFDGYFNENSNLNEDNNINLNQSELRRARLSLKTKWSDNWQSKFQLDLADGIKVKDAYLQYQGWNGVNLSVGQFKEPFGLERQSGSRNLSMIERSMMSDSLAPGRNLGLMFSGQQSSVNWQIGYFQDDNVEKTNALTGRVAWAPVDEKHNLLHLGLAVSERSLHGEEFRINQTFEIHGADSLLEGDRFYADKNSLYGAEIAYGFKGFLAIAEWQQADVLSTTKENYQYEGSYLQLSYLFSGKQRKYRQGSLGKVKSNNDWEVSARFSQLDLLSENESADTYSLGVNYYFNKDTKLMFGYTKAEHFINNLSQGTGEAISFRLQYSF